MHQRHYHRPTSVTIISVLLLVAAVGVALEGIVEIGNPAMKQARLLGGLTVGAGLIFGSSGFFMLRGANWARVLYFAVCFPAKIVGCFFVSPGVILLNLIFTVLVSLCLISENANRFFTGRSTLFARKAGEPRPREGYVSSHPRHRGGGGKYEF